MHEDGTYRPSQGNLQYQHSKYILLAEETILEMSQDPRLHGVLNAANVADDAAFDNMIREILRTTPTIQVEEMDGSTRQRHVIYEYNITWCWNEDEPLEFSEQAVTPNNHVETIIDRPLLGAPVIDEAMYNQHGLHPLSYQDLTDQHGCVIAQIVATVEIVKYQKEGGKALRRAVVTLAARFESGSKLQPRRS